MRFARRWGWPLGAAVVAFLVLALPALDRAQHPQVWDYSAKIDFEQHRDAVLLGAMAPSLVVAIIVFLVVWFTVRRLSAGRG